MRKSSFEQIFDNIEWTSQLEWFNLVPANVYICDSRELININTEIGGTHFEEEYVEFLTEMINNYKNWIQFSMAKNKTYPNIVLTETIRKNIYSYLVYFNSDRWDVESIHPQLYYHISWNLSTEEIIEEIIENIDQYYSYEPNINIMIEAQLN